MRPNDLQDLFGTPSPRLVLWCSNCDATYSAHRGDYFLHAAERHLTCCRRRLKLMKKFVSYQEVTT